MDRSQVEAIVEQRNLPVSCQKPELIETHISWVILCDHFAFKIKKPVLYSFLDFSTSEKRYFYCKQEIILNRRLVDNIYLDVVPIVKLDGAFEIAFRDKGEAVDHAVMMIRMETDRRMDIMIQHNKVTLDHIAQLAEILVKFHNDAEVAYGVNHSSIQHNFNDLDEERDFLSNMLGGEYGKRIEWAVSKSNDFIKSHRNTFRKRSESGLIKDCHGDLHSRNIFLLDKPVIFDCIEFNPEIRRIDILSELAFFCMDLEAHGHYELSEYFMVCYTKLSRTIRSKEESELFTYFKAYRANVRAKVNILRAKDAKGQSLARAKIEIKKYLVLMSDYLTRV